MKTSVRPIDRWQLSRRSMNDRLGSFALDLSLEACLVRRVLFVVQAEVYVFIVSSSYCIAFFSIRNFTRASICGRLLTDALLLTRLEAESGLTPSSQRARFARRGDAEKQRSKRPIYVGFGCNPCWVPLFRDSAIPRFCYSAVTAIAYLAYFSPVLPI